MLLVKAAGSAVICGHVADHSFLNRGAFSNTYLLSSVRRASEFEWPVDFSIVCSIKL